MAFDPVFVNYADPKSLAPGHGLNGQRPPDSSYDESQPNQRFDPFWEAHS